jgi:hypothetical protein
MPTAGYLWVEGTYLHYIDASGVERGQQGTTTGATGTAGYFWIEGYNIHYIDASGNERYLPYSLIGGAGTQGYIWVENTDDTSWIHYINETTGVETKWHTDTAFSNVAHVNTAFSNTAHSDVTHSNNSTAYSDFTDCFLAGTKISMANGSSNKIEDIKIGDRVLSFYNENKLTSASVSKLFSRLADYYYRLKTENHEVNVTGKHPFYTGEGFKKIKEFSIGDKIYILENRKLVPEKIVHKELIKKQVKIYNLKVEASQTYFANGFAVHNKNPHSDNNTAHSNTAFSNVAHVNTAFSNTAHSNTAHVDEPATI